MSTEIYYFSGTGNSLFVARELQKQHGQPAWSKLASCYMCFACLNYCPHQAVQISDIPGVKSSTVTNGRYPHPYATAAEVTAQKRHVPPAQPVVRTE